MGSTNALIDAKRTLIDINLLETGLDLAILLQYPMFPMHPARHERHRNLPTYVKGLQSAILSHCHEIKCGFAKRRMEFQSVFFRSGWNSILRRITEIISGPFLSSGSRRVKSREFHIATKAKRVLVLHRIPSLCSSKSPYSI